MNPEKAHYFAMGCLSFLSSIPGIKYFFRAIYDVKDERLKKELFGLSFKNPVGLAAGFDKDARWFNQLSSLGFGFIEIGTLTPKGQTGNPKPRLFRITDDEGLINRMGFNNLGVEDAVSRLKNRKTNLIIGGNIGKNTATPNDNALDDYVFNFNVLHNYVDYFVVNVSCPNVKDLTKLQDTEFLMELLGELKKINLTKNNPKPILLKIAPDLNDSQLDEVIDIVNATKIDGIIATNTTTSRENLKTTTNRINEIGSYSIFGRKIE